jgi:prevent-host-death family protein
MEKRPRALSAAWCPPTARDRLTRRPASTSLKTGRTMKSVGSYEAKTHLSQLLERVAKGERVQITRHGAAVALLIPASTGHQAQAAAAAAALRAFREGRRLGRGSVKRLIEEGRR